MEYSWYLQIQAEVPDCLDIPRYCKLSGCGDQAAVIYGQPRPRDGHGATDRHQGAGADIT